MKSWLVNFYTSIIIPWTLIEQLINELTTDMTKVLVLYMILYAGVEGCVNNGWHLRDRITEVIY